MNIGKTTRRLQQYGRPRAVEEFPAVHAEVYRDFSRGIVLSNNRESLPPGASPFAVNVQITKFNRVRSIDGTESVEGFGEREPNYMMLHASLDFTAELVFIDAPYMGVKRTGDTVWEDKGLSTGPYAFANYGGTLIFTDGEAVYARQPNDGHNLEILSEAPVARTYASWAGRVWAGAANIDGNFEPLGIVWSAAAEEDTEGVIRISDFRDWNGIGSGFELLIDDMTAGDRVVALRPIGLDFMVVLLRNSIWVGTRTGLTDNPGEFKSRIPGLGAVNEAVCRMTPAGVIFLSDSGVWAFDGNTPRHLSKDIDGDLLPLDYENLDAYWGTYDPQQARYYLHTPCDTWIYELREDRWLKLTLLAEASVVWPIQLPFIRWMDLIGDWNNQAAYRWIDYRGIGEGLADVIFLGDTTEERAIERRKPKSGAFFGQQFESVWECRPISDQNIDKLITTKKSIVEYIGSGRLGIWMADKRGVYEPFGYGDLPFINYPDLAIFTASKTGRIQGIQLRWCAPLLEILQVETIGQLRSERIEPFVP